jgi:hypothetical protein
MRAEGESEDALVEGFLDLGVVEFRLRRRERPVPISRQAYADRAVALERDEVEWRSRVGRLLPGIEEEKSPSASPTPNRPLPRSAACAVPRS